MNPTAMLLALVERMIRLRLVALEDVEAMARGLEAEGELDSAISIRGVWCEVEATPFRASFSDGGNEGG